MPKHERAKLISRNILIPFVSVSVERKRQRSLINVLLRAKLPEFQRALQTTYLKCVGRFPFEKSPAIQSERLRLPSLTPRNFSGEGRHQSHAGKIRSQGEWFSLAP